MGNNIIAFAGKKPEIANGVWIDSTSKIIGEVTIGKDSSIWPMAVLRGDVNRIVIGERTSIQDGTIIHVSHDGDITPGGHPTIIGSDVTIGHGAMLHGCIIEDAVLIGMRAIVLDGAKVEKHAILGAGALLAPGKVVKSGEVWVGAPARRVRKLSDAEIQNLYYSAKQYCILKNQYLSL